MHLLAGKDACHLLPWPSWTWWPMANSPSAAPESETDRSNSQVLRLFNVFSFQKIKLEREREWEAWQRPQQHQRCTREGCPIFSTRVDDVRETNRWNHSKKQKEWEKGKNCQRDEYSRRWNIDYGLGDKSRFPVRQFRRWWWRPVSTVPPWRPACSE